MKKWLLATRPWSFTASVIPLTLGAALAWASDAAHAGLFLLTLLGGVAIQTGTNMLNIYEDYRSGVDTEASAYGESPILLGLIRQGRRSFLQRRGILHRKGKALRRAWLR